MPKPTFRMLIWRLMFKQKARDVPGWAILVTVWSHPLLAHHVVWLQSPLQGVWVSELFEIFPWETILPQAGSSTLVFPFPRTMSLEESQFFGDCCLNSLTAKVRGASVCLFSSSAPARTVTAERVQNHTSYNGYNDTGGYGVGRAMTVLAKQPLG